MSPQEIRDKLMAAINGIIKDEPETADANLHDVLAAKMRARINGEEPEGDPTEDPVATPSEPAPAEPAPAIPTAETVAPTEEPTGA